MAFSQSGMVFQKKSFSVLASSNCSHDSLTQDKITRYSDSETVLNKGKIAKKSSHRRTTFKNCSL